MYSRTGIIGFCSCYFLKKYPFFKFHFKNFKVIGRIKGFKEVSKKFTFTSRMHEGGGDTRKASYKEEVLQIKEYTQGFCVIFSDNTIRNSSPPVLAGNLSFSANISDLLFSLKNSPSF